MDPSTSMEAPLFMTWFQCVVTVLICWGFGILGRNVPEQSFFKQFPEFKYDLSTARKLLPLSFIFVGMMSSGWGGTASFFCTSMQGARGTCLAT